MTTNDEWIAAMTLTLALTGCAMEGSAPALEPHLEGKADFTERVSRRGHLDLGDGVAEASGAFTEDLEFHGYSFRSRGGSAVDVEITQRGSSRGLDTTLFVYAPTGPGGALERATFDDASGWGELSRVEGLELTETATYLVVVGTHLGAGRGDYRLELRCASGDCAAAPLPASCPDAIATYTEDCVDEWLAEGDYQDPRHDAFEACWRDFAADWYDSLCGPGDPAAWCPGGRDAYVDELLPICREELAPSYPAPLPAVAFDDFEVSPEVRARVEAIDDGYGSVVWVRGRRVRPDGEPVTLPRILDTLARADGVPYRVESGATIAQLQRVAIDWGLGADFVPLLEDNAGTTDYEIGHLSANWYVAAGAEAWADLFVLYFDDGVVLTVELQTGEG